LHALGEYSPAALTVPLKATVSEVTKFAATAGTALAAVITPARAATRKPNLNFRTATNIIKYLPSRFV
jgi:hypothetical protein